MTIREAASALRARRVSPVDLTSTALARVERNQPLNAFITVLSDRAMERARQAESELNAGKDRGPLHGIPIAIKDLFAMRGVRNTSGSKVFENLVSDFNSTVVDRLEAAGAVILGKLNMHELAYGTSSDNPYFGAVRNPWNTERSPGGSSGGSGAAVAANIVYGAMGTDTGGSIRIPASYCGTVGLKPTYGRVSRYGVLPLGFTLDHMGPLTRTVRDAAIFLNAIAGRDPKDDTSSRHPTIDFVPDDHVSLRGMRIGFPENFFFERVDPEVESSVRGAIARAASMGAELKPIRVPDMSAINAVGQVTLLAEAAAIMEPYRESRHLFSPEVLGRLDQGRLISGVDYINAQRVRRRMRAEFAGLWQEVDCFVAPATPNTAPKIGEKNVRLGDATEDARIASTRLVRGINVLGLPALSIPCGLNSQGMPIGLQIIGPPFDEAIILKAGAALEDGGVGIPPCPLA
ncbi:MAG TPA: amidase [Bryobacteraceae bacterium]|nr:amidase [Bryobacteraceae bacterium]